MGATDIVRVWGKADDFGIELTYKNGRWGCALPPDMEDGQYAVQLFAEKSNGMIGLWTGILYITNGIRCLHLKEEKYTLWLMPERFKLKLKEECCNV